MPVSDLQEEGTLGVRKGRGPASQLQLAGRNICHAWMTLGDAQGPVFLSEPRL